MRGDEGVVVLVGGELALDLLELLDARDGLLDLDLRVVVRLGVEFLEVIDLGLLGLDRARDGASHGRPAEGALVARERLAVELDLLLLVGGVLGGLEAGVADLDALEIGAHDLGGRAGPAGVDLGLELLGFLGQAELGVDLDELGGGFAALRRGEALGDGRLEELHGLTEGLLLFDLVGGFGLFLEDAGGEGVSADAVFGADGDIGGAEFLEEGQGGVPLGLAGEGFDEAQLGDAAFVVQAVEVLGALGVLGKEGGQFLLGLGPVLEGVDGDGLVERQDRLEHVARLGRQLLLHLAQGVVGGLVLLGLHLLAGPLEEGFQFVLGRGRGGRGLGLGSGGSGDRGHRQEDGEDGGFGQLVGAGLVGGHRVGGAR